MASASLEGPEGAAAVDMVYEGVTAPAWSEDAPAR